MSECSPHQDALRLATAERSRGICDRIVVGLVVLALVRAGEALAGDQASAAAAAGKPEQSNVRQPASFTSSLFAAPEIYRLPSLPESKSFSAKDFRPRGPSIVSDPHLNVADDALIDDTTVWQRLAEYRTRDRLRLLTLWQSGASSVSLQAGRRGDPTLQWTSRLTNGGGPMRSLLDRLFPVTAFSGSKEAHGVARPITAQPAAKGSTSLGALRFEPAASP
jgi:hypothetical protein